MPEQTPEPSTNIDLKECVVLGGSGYSFAPGESVNLRFGSDTLVVMAADESIAEKIPYLEIVDVSISGPGNITTGGGFIGGGFGVGGALQGMAVATVLNLLTTQTKIHTFITAVTHVGELHVHYGGMEPGALRISLSEVFTRLRHLDPTWLRARLERLDALRAQAVLSQGEFDRLKQRLLVPPAPLSRVKPLAGQNSVGNFIRVSSRPTACAICGSSVLVLRGSERVQCAKCGKGYHFPIIA
jgi:hypothetical protein